MKAPVRVSLISLGCPKNLVDSEVLLGHAVSEGLQIVRDPEDADVAVVNTCGFIDSAKEESIQTILDVARLKEEGLRGLVVVGCLSQRYGDELRQDIPEIDAVLGITDYSRVPQLLDHLARGGDDRFKNDAKGGNLRSADSDLTRLRLTPNSFSYLRIGEGCDHKCTFCAIPAIRGRQRSKPIETLVSEAEAMAATGVRELVLVAEDSTAYGLDQEGKRLLPQLLDALSEVDGIEWLRVLYAYPHTVRPELTARLRENPKVVPYIDIPIQHISTPMLKAMKRGVSKEQVMRILHRLRDEVPGIAVRSTYIVGFPGESDADFEELLELTREYRFERLGVFPYSSEEGTPAFGLEGEVPEDLVNARIEAIMQLSKRNIEERNQSLLGQTIRVLVDHEHPNPKSLGFDGPASVARSFADAPEIDCSVHVSGAHPSGSFLDVRVRGVAEYDLIVDPV
ncbi:MAG: 30S ribosomal protein S12 methylthiotransferase RimO [Planctomycetota bacterium]|nr:MAG: 30S ribosomal protein S12 methylthiotransferase RimO [Planctomycetota bacterium]